MKAYSSDDAQKGGTVMPATQCERVLRWMQTNGSITQLEALTKLGVMRLASRISDMKRQGIEITDKMVTVENRYGEKCRVKQYRLK